MNLSRSISSLFILMLAVALVLPLHSCKEKLTEPNDDGNNNNTSPFDFPVPDVDNIGGMVGVAGIVSGSLTVPTGFGAFFAADQQTLVYGGNVTINGTALDTLSGAYFKASGLSVNFNGSSTVNVAVAGSGSVTAWNDNITAPSASSITGPAANAAVTKTSGLTVTWNGTGGTDSVIVIAQSSGSSGTPSVKSGLANNGSVTFSASELSGIPNGNGLITLVKYRYKVVASGGKNYVLVAETIHYLNVTFN